MKDPKVLMHVRTIAAFTALVVFALVLMAREIEGTFRFAGQQDGRDEVRLELSRNGFRPTEVQHAPGTFAIAVENKTSSGAYTLRLKAADGTVVSEVQVQKGSLAWTVNLPTGKYTLTEVSHPQWTCRIVVQ